MMPESGCSHKDLGAWRTYHQHRQHSHNALKGLLIKQTSETWHWLLPLNFQVQNSRVVGRMIQDAIYYGPHFQKCQTLVVN